MAAADMLRPLAAVVDRERLRLVPPKDEGAAAVVAVATTRVAAAVTVPAAAEAIAPARIADPSLIHG
jgi:hypothetical protein